MVHRCTQERGHLGLPVSSVPRIQGKGRKRHDCVLFVHSCDVRTSREIHLTHGANQPQAVWCSKEVLHRPNKLAWCDLERFCQPRYVDERNISFAALYITYIGAVDFSQFCQFLLR
jgi:hypothetical protein